MDPVFVFGLVLVLDLILFAFVVVMIERAVRRHTHARPLPEHAYPVDPCPLHRLVAVATETVNGRNVEISRCRTCETLFRDEAP